MTAKTHSSSWRFLVSGAPLLGAGFIVFGVLQGEADMARSPVVYAALLGVAAVGALVAWSVARHLASTPVVRIRDAQEGYVAVRGRAEPLPNAPLVSTRGVPCVWFERSEGRQHGRTGTYRSFDSARPFMLADATGRCIIAPRGANVTGGNVETDAAGRERRIVAGDELFIAGQFRRLDAGLIESLDHELRTLETPVGITRQTSDPAGLREMDLQKEFDAARDTAARVLAQASVPSLPVIKAPDGLAPFIISADDADGGASMYRWLMRVDAAIAALCVAALGWLRLGA